MACGKNLCVSMLRPPHWLSLPRPRTLSFRFCPEPRRVVSLCPLCLRGQSVSPYNFNHPLNSTSNAPLFFDILTPYRFHTDSVPNRLRSIPFPFNPLRAVPKKQGRGVAALRPIVPFRESALCGLRPSLARVPRVKWVKGIFSCPPKRTR